MGKRTNVYLSDEAATKLHAIKKVVGSVNVSQILCDAIMAYDPLEVLNASMPEGFEVVRSKPVQPTRKRYRSDTVVEVVRSNSDYKDF